jgi:hypothetical protein
MKYVKTYESFKENRKGEDAVNEELFGLGNLLAAAKGAFKNFLTGIQAPFKAISADFKKGLKRAELKTKITQMLDNLLKTTSDSINKAEDEAALNNIVDQFDKSFEQQCAEIDKEIKTIKESKSINESVRDSLIAGRVMLGMIKQKAAEIKMEFDKKVAAAKDLAGKKQARIAEIKAIVDDFKKKVTDDKYLDEQTKKYAEENKIKAPTGGGDKIILDWGDVDIEISKLPEDDENGKKGYFQITKSGSKKLVVKEGEVVLAKISGDIKKGDKATLSEILRAGNPDPLKEYTTGSIEMIQLNGKEVPNYKFGQDKPEGQEDLVKTLGEVKTKNPEAMKDLDSIASIYSDPTNPKIKEIQAILAKGAE